MVLYARLFGVLRENTLYAYDITCVGHYEKSLLRDNDSCCYLCRMKIISSDWIALLRRLLMDFNDSGCKDQVIKECIWYILDSQIDSETKK